MKKSVNIGNKNYDIRGLTWGEKKALKNDGCNIASLNPMADNDELVEKVIVTVCGDGFVFDEMDSGDVYKLFGEIHKLTFMTGEESKN